MFQYRPTAKRCLLEVVPRVSSVTNDYSSDSKSTNDFDSGPLTHLHTLSIQTNPVANHIDSEQFSNANANEDSMSIDFNNIVSTNRNKMDVYKVFLQNWEKKITFHLLQ